MGRYSNDVLSTMSGYSNDHMMVVSIVGRHNNDHVMVVSIIGRHSNDCMMGVATYLDVIGGYHSLICLRVLFLNVTR